MNIILLDIEGVIMDDFNAPDSAYPVAGDIFDVDIDAASDLDFIKHYISGARIRHDVKVGLFSWAITNDADKQKVLDKNTLVGKIVQNITGELEAEYVFTVKEVMECIFTARNLKNVSEVDFHDFYDKHCALIQFVRHSDKFGNNANVTLYDDTVPTSTVEFQCGMGDHVRINFSKVDMSQFQLD